MTWFEYADLVARMRKAQRAYFKGRSSFDLDESKRLEREVDRATKEMHGPATQPTLFDLKEAP